MIMSHITVPSSICHCIELVLSYAAKHPPSLTSELPNAMYQRYGNPDAKSPEPLNLTHYERNAGNGN